MYAIGNYDPASDANVLARGIVGDIGGEIVVASPIYKQHFSLRHGPLPGGAAVRGPRLSRAGPRRADLGAGQAGAATVIARRKPRLVVIGNGMAAMRTVEELLEVRTAGL